MNTIGSFYALPATPSAPATVPAEPPAPADSFAPSLSYAPVGDTQIARVSGGWSGSESQRKRVADEILAHLKAWPSLHAVIAVGERPDGNTSLLVAGRPDAASQSVPQGVFGIISSLASSPSVKIAAAQHPAPFQSAQAVESNADGSVYELRLPGEQDASSIGSALAEGRKPNPKEQMAAFLQELPRGRVVVLLAGPSGAGKTTLIKDLQALAGDRKIVAMTGDMYFRDVDDPEYPKTAQGTHYFDSPEAMHMDELAADVAELLREGKADIPVYDFAASRPGGWRTPVTGVTGIRLDRKEQIELGADDILVIDSIHAANGKIVGELQKDGLPQYTLYLDSEKAEDRLLRRIVRDFAQREGPAERTLQFWDLTTFPGEVHFVRPTMLQMDPSRDLYYVTKFGTDLGLSKDEIDHKVEMLARYGLAPTYPAFATPDDKLADFATTEKTRLQAVVSSNASDAEKAAAQRALDRLEAARLH